MGGDHKCPVCQATFTRPQHVARHMRSHTGDRPYKCQYCGDQFARSDLLSRHVNKCHANEKPLPTVGSARRKGSASASRATTSKQACDQCVQSSLPCDGCNPCSKCVHRKCRCTYVKFHRQTAPAGPGHNPRPQNSMPSSASLLQSASSSRIPIFPQHPEDDFILGPPPPGSSTSGGSPTSSAGGGPGGVQTMAETLLNSNTFAFPTLYPTISSADNLGVGVAVSETIAAQQDYAAKYRAQAQAELFGSSATSGLGGVGTGLTPTMYDPRAGSASSSSTAASSTAGGPSWLGWETTHSDSADPYAQHHQQQQQHQRQLGGRHPHAEMIPASSASSSSGPAMHGSQAQAQAQQHYTSSTSTTNMHTQHAQTHGLAPPRRGSESVDYEYDVYEYDEYDRYPVSRGAGRRGSDGSPGRPPPPAPSSSSAASSSSTSLHHLPVSMGFGMGGVGVGHQHHHQHQHQHQHQQHQHQQQRGQQGHGQQQQHHHQHGQHGQQAMYTTGYNMGMIPDRSATASTSSSSSSSQQHHRGTYVGGGGASADAISSSTSTSASASAGGYPAQAQDERQEFSSAFGLMSLDDPNVIAGLAVDGQPFFSDVNAPDTHTHAASSASASASAGDILMGQDVVTPMPMSMLMKHETGAGAMLQMPLLDAKGSTSTTTTTPSRENDTKELREFWRQYMRTPLSGPGNVLGLGGGGDGGPAASSSSSTKGSTSNSTPRNRRPRVASLPSVKTPVMEHDEFYSPSLTEILHGVGGHASGSRTGDDDDDKKAKDGPMSSIRTTLHGHQEDLRSYEAAVMARKAPTNLNLQIRKPIKSRSGVSPSNYAARPRSAVDEASTSSLANAFGGPSAGIQDTVQHQQRQQQQVNAAPTAPSGYPTDAMKKEDSASPPISVRSEASSSAVDDSENSPSTDQDSARPSFKRLPSQTLGPMHAKRVFLGSSGREEGAAAGDHPSSVQWTASVGTMDSDQNSTVSRVSGLSGLSHPDHIVASLSEKRLRRMSAPSSSSPLPLHQPPPPPGFGQPSEGNQGQIPYGGGMGQLTSQTQKGGSQAR